MKYIVYTIKIQKLRYLQYIFIEIIGFEFLVYKKSDFFPKFFYKLTLNLGLFTIIYEIYSLYY